MLIFSLKLYHCCRGGVDTPVVIFPRKMKALDDTFGSKVINKMGAGGHSLLSHFEVEKLKKMENDPHYN